MKYRELVRLIERAGWVRIRTTGSHVHFRHPTRPGIVTIPAGGKEGRDVPPGTLRSVLKQAGLVE